MDSDGAQDRSQSRQGVPNDPEQAPPDLDSPPTDASSKAKLSRKRTKTGCLTCRKRRIKCGEEQPVCKNCVKSKRTCEGYSSQRVLLHHPVNDYSVLPNGGAHIAFQSVPYPGQFVPYDAGHGGGFTAASGHHPYPLGEQGQPVLHYAASSAYPPHPPPSLQPHSTSEPVHGVPIIHSSEGRDVNAMLLTSAPPLAPYIGYPIPASSAPTFEHTPTIQQPMYHPRSTAHPPAPLPYMIAPRPINTNFHSSASTAPFHSSPYGSSPAFDPQNRVWPSQYQPRSDSIHPDEPLPLPASAFHAGHPTAPRTLPSQNFPSPELYQETRVPFSADTTKTLLGKAAVETQDDDYYDIASDEEMDIDSSSAVTGLAHEQLQKLHRILQVNNIRVHDLETRQHDGFLYEGILDHYRVEDAANPLRNPATARVFAHFIAVTGPCLSVFERRPRNASVLFADGKVPFSQQGLWTYTMPVAALHHQGLLHSMLALASLHIARLQNASDTPSRQHYAWACKRINHLLGRNSKKRHQTTTIAASMLLGFYEILTADHRAWNMHLKGSKQLFLETDFVSLARKFRRMKREKEEHAEGQHDTMSSPTSSAQDEILSQITDVDDAMISSLFGSEVSYDGPVPEESVPQPLDLSNFEILKDLYWWYLKQDAYQSIISGNPLLLDYSQWADCPPRAPLGRLDAVYGSFDHLILLLGRIADFSARDRKRKLRQMEANGGQWRPAPGMSLPGTPRHSGPNTPTWLTPNGQPAPATSYFPVPSQQASASTAQETPQFFGMAPPPRQSVQMPAAYTAAPPPPTYPQQPPAASSPSLDEPDLKTATEQAMEEYGRLRAALLQFSRSLGPGFDPLTSEFQPPLDTPFGTALFYRSYDISCLWAVFHMAEIIAIRSHPHMHPAAHAAAAIASHQTAYQATEIGRITAALVPGPPDTALNPMLAAALCETCVPSFFAAVQYKNAQQRHATVSRIKYIAQRTGWGSAEVIANGCETAWVKAYEAGRGPPYTRIARSNVSDDPRLNGAWEKAEAWAGKAEDDRGLVRTQADARLQWAIGVLGMEEDA